MCQTEPTSISNAPHRRKPMCIDLPDDEAHVWYQEVSTTNDANSERQDVALLSADEQTRHARFRFDRDRQLYLTSHVFLRRTLSKYAALEPSTWQFIVTERGRPEISNPMPCRLRFNLTHTRGLCACVVTRTLDCGVDAESIAQRRNLSGVAARMFSPAEAKALEALNGETYLHRFYWSWTLREAYVKARGIGIGFPTRSLRFIADDAQGVSLAANAETEPNPEHWHFHSLQPTNAHLLSVAVRTDNTRQITFRCFPAND